jgi:hypothetical protein
MYTRVQRETSFNELIITFCVKDWGLQGSWRIASKSVGSLSPQRSGRPLSSGLVLRTAQAHMYTHKRTKIQKHVYTHAHARMRARAQTYAHAHAHAHISRVSNVYTICFSHTLFTQNLLLALTAQAHPSFTAVTRAPVHVELAPRRGEAVTAPGRGLGASEGDGEVCPGLGGRIIHVQVAVDCEGRAGGATALRRLHAGRACGRTHGWLPHQHAPQLKIRRRHVD